MPDNDLQKLKLLLSENIKTLRREKGIAQERLGLEAGVDRTLVSKIERTVANPSLEILFKIATRLEVSVADLLADNSARKNLP